MANAKHKGLRRIFNAFFYSMAGFVATWKHEAAFRQEVILSIILFPTAFWLGKNAVQISLLLLTIFIVLITELLNTGVEVTIDRISDESHKLSKRAKDIGSAAVFTSLAALIIVWGIIIYERFF